MLFVVDADAARLALRGSAVGLPPEGLWGRSHPRTAARTRTLTVGVGQRQAVTPDRGRLRGLPGVADAAAGVVFAVAVAYLASIRGPSAE
jgi:hypothetical protein